MSQTLEQTALSSAVASEADDHGEEVEIRANLALWDRALRIVLGAFFLHLGWAGVVAGGAGTTLKVVGFFVLASGVLGWCFFYTVLGIQTRKIPVPVAVRG